MAANTVLYNLHSIRAIPRKRVGTSVGTDETMIVDIIDMQFHDIMVSLTLILTLLFHVENFLQKFHVPVRYMSR